MGKPKRNRALGREGNIKMDLLQVGWGGIDWIAVAQDRGNWRAVGIAVMKFRVT